MACVITGFQVKAQQICPIEFDGFGTTFELDKPILNTYIDGSVIMMPPPPPPPPPPEGDYRKVVTWVHGMNGSATTWQHAYQYAKEEYFAFPLRVDYSGNQALMSTAIFDVELDIETQWTNMHNFVSEAGEARSFGITHSLGGVVLRAASEGSSILEGKINGIVTVDAPHGGSNLAWYVETQNGGGDATKIQNLKDISNETCKAFAIGPLEEFTTTNPFASAIESVSLGFIEVGELLTNTTCDVLTPYGVPMMISNIAPKCVSELTPGSAILEINEDVPMDNKMLFYGDILQDPDAHNSAFKMFYSAQNSPDEKEVFKAGEQTQEALDEYQHNLNFYNDKYIRWRDTYDDKWSWTPGWACVNSSGFGWCLTWNDVKKMRNGYNRGRFQFNRFNDAWEVITGARTFSQSNLGTCDLETDYGGWYIYDITEEDCYDEEDYDVTVSWSSNIETTLIGYDGFLTVESQKDWDIPEQYKYPMIGSNHLQVKNDANAKCFLDITFNGQGRPFFGQ